MMPFGSVVVLDVKYTRDASGYSLKYLHINKLVNRSGFCCVHHLKNYGAKGRKKQLTGKRDQTKIEWTQNSFLHCFFLTSPNCIQILHTQKKKPQKIEQNKKQKR
jgi:hypothetical protein